MPYIFPLILPVVAAPCLVLTCLLRWLHGELCSIAYGYQYCYCQRFTRAIIRQILFSDVTNVFRRRHYFTFAPFCSVFCPDDIFAGAVTSPVTANVIRSKNRSMAGNSVQSPITTDIFSDPLNVTAEGEMKR